MDNGSIVKEAITLFLRYGIKAVSMDDIAKRVGISKRTLYESFISKDDLLMSCVEELHRRRNEELAEIFKTAPDTMSAFMQCLFTVDMASRSVNPLFLEELCRYHRNAISTSFARITESSIEGLRGLLDKAKAEGMIRTDTNTDLVARVFIWQMSPHDQIGTAFEGYSKDQLFMTISINFFRGLSTPKGQERIEELLCEYRREHGMVF